MPGRIAADQRYQEIAGFIVAHSDVFAAQGAVVQSWRTQAGRRRGPYFRLAYRTDGRQRSIYLGSSQALARRIRHLLVQLQSSRRQSRVHRRTRALVVASLRRAKVQLDHELQVMGLYRKGLEIRGWRGTTRTCTIPDTKEHAS